MIFPDRYDALEARVLWLIDRCKATQRDRVNVYDRRERYFLFGTAGSDPVRYNRIESHLDLVSSFLYAPDHAFYHIAAARNAPDGLVKQVTALQDEYNDDFSDWGWRDMFAEAIPWSLCYGSMFIKQGWNNVAQQGIGTLVAPHAFGVFREDVPNLESQEAFVHTFALEFYDAVQRVVRAGRASDIERIAVIEEPRPSPFPDMLTRLVIAGTGGVNLSGNMLGSVNPDYTPLDTYQPRSHHPVVMFDELWAWDSECNDYRVFHVIEPDILIGDSKRTIKAMLSVPKYKTLLEDKAKRSRRRRKALNGELVTVLDEVAPGEDDTKLSQSNLFFPGEHPFTKIQAYTKWNYFWGKPPIDALFSLQDWMNERFEQIAEILERQAYPPRVGTGMAGTSDEKFEAFGAADSYILEQMPNAKVEELHPELPPDLFAELKEIAQFFLEAAGLTEVIAQGGGEGVRSGTHAKQAARTGSGRIKKAALNLEGPLVRMGDIGLKLKMRNDDRPMVPEGAGDKPGAAFLAAQVAGDVKMRIAGHSHSPLFADDARELAAVLLKAEAIDQEMFVRLLHPPSQDAIIHALRQKQAAHDKMMASLPQEARIAMLTGQKPKAHHAGSH